MYQRHCMEIHNACFQNFTGLRRPTKWMRVQVYVNEIRIGRYCTFNLKCKIALFVFVRAISSQLFGTLSSRIGLFICH